MANEKNGEEWGLTPFSVCFCHRPTQSVQNLAGSSPYEASFDHAINRTSRCERTKTLEAVG